MIAVTGANGLLGSFLIRKLIDENLLVTAIVRKKSDLSLIKDLIDKITIKEADINDPITLLDSLKESTAVIHTAALVSFNPRLSKSIFRTNVEGTKNVVDVCLSLGIKKLIHISSVAALGRDKEIKHINENNKWIESDLNTDYAKSKYLAELEIFRGQEEGLNISVVNPSIILAPSDWNKSSSQIFKYAWKESPFYINNSINYVDVRDVVEIIYSLLKKNFPGQKFIANGGTISTEKLLSCVAERFNKKPPSININSFLLPFIARIEEIRCFLKKVEPIITRQSIKTAKYGFEYDNKKAIDELGTTFHTIEETLDWCCRNYLDAFSTNK